QRVDSACPSSIRAVEIRVSIPEARPANRFDFPQVIASVSSQHHVDPTTDRRAPCQPDVSSTYRRALVDTSNACRPRRVPDATRPIWENRQRLSHEIGNPVMRKVSNGPLPDDIFNAVNAAHALVLLKSGECFIVYRDPDSGQVWRRPGGLDL